MGRPLLAKLRRPRGRPVKREIEKLDATPEEVAKAIFAAVDPPDPSKRKKRSASPNSG